MKVWNLKTDLNIPEDAVYVGRPSKWGNPYTVEEYGRGEALKLFCEHVLPHMDVSELEGKDLICFCAPKNCHADFLLLKANGPALFSE